MPTTLRIRPRHEWETEVRGFIQAACIDRNRRGRALDTAAGFLAGAALVLAIAAL